MPEKVVDQEITFPKNFALIMMLSSGGEVASKRKNHMKENQNHTDTFQTNTVEIPEAEKIVKINFDELKPNTVIIIKIAPEGIQQRILATQQIAKALQPFRDKIKERGIVLLVMSTDETFETVDEEQMNSMGWFKKEVNRIIVPK